MLLTLLEALKPWSSASIAVICSLRSAERQDGRSRGGDRSWGGRGQALCAARALCELKVEGAQIVAHVRRVFAAEDERKAALQDVADGQLGNTDASTPRELYRALDAVGLSP